MEYNTQKQIDILHKIADEIEFKKIICKFINIEINNETGEILICPYT